MATAHQLVGKAKARNKGSSGSFKPPTSTTAPGADRGSHYALGVAPGIRMPIQTQAIQLQREVEETDATENSGTVQTMCLECEAERGEVDQPPMESTEAGDSSAGEAEDGGSENPELIQRQCAECAVEYAREDTTQPKPIQRDGDENPEPTEKDGIAELQAKLIIGAANDHYENEADRVADHVVTDRPVVAISSVADKNIATNPAELTMAEGQNGENRNGNDSGGRELQQADTGGEDAHLQKQSGRGESASDGSIADALSHVGAGNALDASIKGSMESNTGLGFDRVRVHTDSASHRANKALEARAFTHGSDIWLGEGESQNDQHLMAHELTHVVQQSGESQTIQRAPADYRHPEDGGNVLARMNQKLDDEGVEQLSSPSARNSDQTGETESRGQEPSIAAPSGPAASEARQSARDVDRSEINEQKQALAEDAKPDVDRPAQELPKVEQAEAQTKAEVESPAEPLAEGEEQTPEGAAADEESGASEAAETAAGATEQAFSAEAEAVPVDIQPLVQPPPIVGAPVDSAGDPLPPDPVADDEVAFLTEAAQNLRTEGTRVKQHAAEEVANAATLEGNINLIGSSIEQSESAVGQADEHLDYRRGVASQAREALTVSEEKAERVASEAPGFRDDAAEAAEDSGPMASEAGGLSEENEANVPEDPEAAQKAREQGGKINEVRDSTGTMHNAVEQTQERAEGLIADAEQASKTNEQTGEKLDSLDDTLDQTGERLEQMTGQNQTAREQMQQFRSAPSRMINQARALDARGDHLIRQSEDIEAQLHSVQQDYEAAMRGVPAAPEPEESGAEGLIQRAGYEGRESVDLMSLFSSPDPRQVAARERAAADAEDARRRRVDTIREMAGGNFEELDAADKMGIALRMTGRNLFGGLDNIGWPSWGDVGSGLGHLALGLINPIGPLQGVVSGLNMTLSGVANLLSGEQWAEDPFGNLLKSAADIATGITIILGSITALAGVIIALMMALSIVTLGAAAPITGPVIAFCSTVMTTVGGWTIVAGLIALELQAFCLIKNLIEAATADTADELATASDRMAEDASNAGNAAMQVGMARLGQVGGRQMQSAIGGRGGVRFAAELGARSPLASARAGIREMGLRGYGRHLGGGIGTGARQAGSYLRTTSVTQGAKDLASGARGVWRSMTHAEGPPMSGREGISRRFLLGDDIGRGGRSARAVTREVREEAFEAAGAEARALASGSRTEGAAALPDQAPTRVEPEPAPSARAEPEPVPAAEAPPRADIETGTPTRAEPEAPAGQVIEEPVPGTPERPVDLDAEPAPAGASRESSARQSSLRDSPELSQQQLADELAEVQAHPELMEGRPPNRTRRIGEHTWEERPGGGWCRRSTKICMRPLDRRTPHVLDEQNQFLADEILDDIRPLSERELAEMGVRNRAELDEFLAHYEDPYDGIRELQRRLDRIEFGRGAHAVESRSVSERQPLSSERDLAGTGRRDRVLEGDVSERAFSDIDVTSEMGADELINAGAGRQTSPLVTEPEVAGVSPGASRTGRQSGIGTGEGHHIATHYGRRGERFKRMAEKAYGGEEVSLPGTDQTVHPIHHPANIAEDLVPHGEQRGWFQQLPNGRRIHHQRGHHPEYHEWVERHLREVHSQPGIGQHQLLVQHTRALARLRRLVERYPYVLTHGYGGLPARFHTLAIGSL